MIKKLQFVLHVIWAVAAITLAVTIGVVFGWTHHGLVAAIALGFVGLCVGALVAASPSSFFQLLG